jgi:hypothetical protein
VGVLRGRVGMERAGIYKIRDTLAGERGASGKAYSAFWFWFGLEKG